MDKILAFSILSSTPAEIAAAGYTTMFSWRTSAGKQQQKPAEKAQKKEGEKQQEARPRFAPEFDGINCFESIVSF
uniref:Uncharacterized protein n=1 Tax=Leersia perrieri TaxID=77586 RepID=A0A0D9WLF9_9ORYZ